MGRWHIDPECERRLSALNDALCSFERDTGRGCVLILVPNAPDEKVHLSANGKPLPNDFRDTPEEVLAVAMEKRGKALVKAVSLAKAVRRRSS